MSPSQTTNILPKIRDAPSAQTSGRDHPTSRAVCSRLAPSPMAEPPAMRSYATVARPRRPCRAVTAAHPPASSPPPAALPTACTPLPSGELAPDHGQLHDRMWASSAAPTSSPGTCMSAFDLSFDYMSAMRGTLYVHGPAIRILH